MSAKCSKCKETKARSEFSPSKNPYKVNGLSSWCRDCNREGLRVRRGSNGTDKRQPCRYPKKEMYMKRIRQVAKKAENLAAKALRFAGRVAEVHPEEGYQVDLLSYRGMMEPVTFTCPKHGKVTMKAANLIHQKSKCKLCSSKFADKPHDVYLVILDVEGELCAKVGISHKLDNRFNVRITGNKGIKLVEVVKTIKCENEREAQKVEKPLLAIAARYPQAVAEFAGHTECGSLDMLSYVREAMEAI